MKCLATARGVIPNPIPPAPGASIEQVIAYLRASAAYNDAVSTAANRAFDVQFRKSLRGVP